MKIKCDHANCKLKFKTQKQKLNHHNKFEKKCFIERNSLIKLASRYKKLYIAILKEFKINGIVENTDDYLSLKNEVEKSLKNSYDHSFFFSKLW